jgi:hypothetical protein
MKISTYYKQHFLDTASWLRSHDIAVDFNQGLDVRLMDQEIVDTLASLKAYRSWRIAFDSMAYKDQVLRAIGMMRDAGISLKHGLMCYVYCHCDHELPDAVARCQILKGEGVTAFSMLNIDAPCSPRMQKLKDWTRPWSFWSCDYEDYSRAYKGEKKPSKVSEEEYEMNKTKKSEAATDMWQTSGDVVE